MRAILALYLLTPVTEGGIGLPPANALSLTAIYSAGAYLTSVIGGWLADRFLGARRTVLTGGIVIMCGHILLAVPTTSLFYVGLAAVVLGTGLLKPNIASLVGALYSVNDHRRDFRFFDLLHGDQHRRVRSASGVWLAGPRGQLSRRLRRRGDRHRNRGDVLPHHVPPAARRRPTGTGTPR